MDICFDIHLVSECGRRPLRSSTDRTLTVPRTHNRFGDRSFAVAGPRLWNSLPISLRQISSYGQLQFRRYLKNHLFHLGFEKSQRSVTHDSLRYINILTYLLTYLKLSNVGALGLLIGRHTHTHADRCDRTHYQAALCRYIMKFNINYFLSVIALFFYNRTSFASCNSYQIYFTRN